MLSKPTLLGNQKRGRIFIMSAPAGTGKTTLIHRLKKEFPQIVQSISYVSRDPRPNEKNGVDYHFITKEAFEKKIEKGEFLEFVRLYNDYYGTDKQWVEEQIAAGFHVFLVIDTQGAMKLKEKINAIFIFIQPPSIAVLEERIRKRKTESKEAIEKRLAWAQEELKLSSKYDYLIINDDFEIAYKVLSSIVIAEDHRQETNSIDPY